MAQMRSPAYPSLSLSAAVEMIRKVHSKQQTKPEPRKVVMQHMGYSSENGRALKSISALIKYGFLSKDGEAGLRVSKRAMSILYPKDEEDKRDALRAAANEPALFEDIFRRWEGKRPSQESLKHHLIHRGFNMNSVEHVARAFYETFDLVSGGADSYDSGSGTDEPLDKIEDEAMPEAQQKPPSLASVVSKVMEHANTVPNLNVTKPVFDFETVRVNTVINNRDDLEELITRLQQLMPMLPPLDDWGS